MAGKTTEMSQSKQILLLKKEGVSNRKAAGIVGINQETVNNYVRRACADELDIEGLLRLDAPVLEHRLQGGNPAYCNKRFEGFKDLLPYLQEEMKRKHVTSKFLLDILHRGGVDAETHRAESGDGLERDVAFLSLDFDRHKKKSFEYTVVIQYRNHAAKVWLFRHMYNSCPEC